MAEHLLWYKKSVQMSSDHLLVAVVDVGIPYSEYGVSLLSNKDVIDVRSFLWSLHGNMKLTNSTTLLLDQKKNFVAFGYEAVEAYEALVEDGKEKEYYYIDLCSSPLDTNKLTIKSTLTDATGKEILIKDVFTHGIAYLTKRMLSTLNESTPVSIKDVKWVFIAPFGREDDMALMRETAEKAGIELDHCTVTTRYEALMFYFMDYLRKENVGCHKIYNPENQYILVDAREYDAEITVMEIQANGKMKQITNIKDSSCGHIKVLHSFERLLGRVFGEDALEKYKEIYNIEFQSIMEQFLGKLTVHPSDDEIRFSLLPLNNFCNLEKCIGCSEYRGKWRVTGSRIRMPLGTIKHLLDEPSQRITELVKKCLEMEQTSETHTILMTGKLSVIPIFQEYLKLTFPEMCIITSKDVSTELNSVVGGVLLGKNNGILPKSDFKLDFGIETYADIDFVPKHV